MKLPLTGLIALGLLALPAPVQAARIHSKAFDADVPSKVTVGMLVRNGLTAKVTCHQSCRFVATLAIDAADARAMGFKPQGFQDTVGLRIATVERKVLGRGQQATLRYRIDRATRQRIARAHRSFKVEGSLLA